MHLAQRVQTLKPKVLPSPWPGYEHFYGYGVMILPWSSGHLLGLRVFPENDFAPYCSVWHRPPGEGWHIHNDGPSLRTTCPRWWGPALQEATLTSIDLTWTGPNRLRVELEEPDLEWTMEMSAPWTLHRLNAASAALPLPVWKMSPALHLGEWMAKRWLDLGDLRFSFETPSGQSAAIIPQEIFFIRSSEARLQGKDLGQPVRLPENPEIGSVALPKRPVFMIGHAFARILDAEEYRQMRRAVAPSESRS